MSKRNKKNDELLSNQECLDKLILAASTLDCTRKALRELKLKQTSNLVNDALQDVLRVAAVFQHQLIKAKVKEANDADADIVTQFKKEVESK